MAVAMALGQPWNVALCMGYVLALSSTAIVLQTPTEYGQMKSCDGPLGFSVLPFKDVAVIPLLALAELADIASTNAAIAQEAYDTRSGLTATDVTACDAEMRRSYPLRPQSGL
jgi:CPA2 family monovalent cation:H+ antiporter-2